MPGVEATKIKANQYSLEELTFATQRCHLVPFAALAPFAVNLLFPRTLRQIHAAYFDGVWLGSGLLPLGSGMSK